MRNIFVRKYVFTFLLYKYGKAIKKTTKKKKRMYSNKNVYECCVVLFEKFVEGKK